MVFGKTCVLLQAAGIYVAPVNYAAGPMAIQNVTA